MVSPIMILEKSIIGVSRNGNKISNNKKEPAELSCLLKALANKRKNVQAKRLETIANLSKKLSVRIIPKNKKRFQNAPLAIIA